MTVLKSKAVELLVYIYYAVVILWWLGISIYIITTVTEFQKIKAIEERQREYYFEYSAITSKKEVYGLGEPIELYSDRTVKKNT
jgi:hypothetical protein